YFIGEELKLPKLKSLVKANLHREILGEIKSATISAKNNQLFFVSILCLENVMSLPKTGESIGVAYCSENLVQMSSTNVFLSRKSNSYYQLKTAKKRLELRAKLAKKKKSVVESGQKLSKAKKESPEIVYDN
ncbi:transposase, partial [Tetragenococcus halophilus]|nr:transposase [Tetragenococcus halophilus]